MRPLRYSINVTFDGSCHHEAVTPDEELHRHFAEALVAADALLFGRTTYEMMEEAWRRGDDGVFPGWMDDWMVPFAEVIDAAPKHVVSSTLTSVDWNAELVRGDLGDAVRALKARPGDGLHVGGVTLPRALAEIGLIDEYELVVHPVVAGHGPYLLAGLPRLQLEPIGTKAFASGAVAHRFRPAPTTD